MAEPRREVHFRFGQHPARRRASSAIREQLPFPTPLPRITRLMAVAIYWDSRRRECRDLDGRALAQLGRVSRARITQISNLLHLAPDIQERLLRLAPLARGREPVTEKSLRRLAQDYDWQGQRERFEALMCRRIERQEGNR